MTASSDTVEPTLKSKPGIRATLREKFVERMKEQPKSLCVVGACDFFGPHVTSNSFLGDVFLGNMVVKQQKPLVIGSGDKVHDFCFARDFSQALYNVSLPSNHDKSMGKFWICPHSIHNKTLKQLSDDVSGMLAGDSNKKISGVSSMPAWVVHLLGVFMPFMYEMRDMLPIWMNDYSVDDSDFCETFGVQATPYEEALRETIEFFESLKKDNKQ
jgi:nucleoside-diphosphate-sugar epimerase